MSEYVEQVAEDDDPRRATFRELAEGQTYVFLRVGTKNRKLIVDFEAGGDIRNGDDLLTVMEFATEQLSAQLSGQ